MIISTAPQSYQYSEACIMLLISQLEKMRLKGITIEQFHKVLKQIDELHKIQLEIIDIEMNLDLPAWNGDYSLTN